MGKSKAEKSVVITDLKENLSQAQMAMVIDPQGLTVAEITDLRRKLLPKGTVCKVTKNTLMKIAIEDNPTWQPMEEFLKGSTAVLLTKEDIPGAIKAYQEFQKATKKTELKGGVMEGKALNESQIKAISELPSKEQLMGQVAGAINSLAAKIAIAINEVPSSLARGIKAVSEKE
ncbi:MAG: 50S ribosomal protein L10 [Coleofasciculaceae cyanobacterium SM2_1_6]|nr:50S ribosomal protein L10 [Coleofasciculaceae cyanobacterium SM2_1_6]